MHAVRLARRWPRPPRRGTRASRIYLDPQDPSGELTGSRPALYAAVRCRRALRQPDRRYAQLHQGQLIGEPSSYLYEWTVGRVVYPASDAET